MKVFYLGPEGSYSFVLARQVFADFENIEFVPCDNFDEINDKTALIDNSVGVLPFENSITSSVHDNIDGVFYNHLQVVGESELHINLHLFGLKGAKIENLRRVFSYSKALHQAANFLKRQGLVGVDVDSTSQAKADVVEKKDPSNGFIGSRDLVDSQVEILKEGVGDEKHNYTRFIFVSKDDIDLFKKSRNKRMIKFNTKHEPAALAKVLTELGDIGANLTKIESRPIPGTDWEYSFLVELICDDLEQLEKVLEEATYRYWILGSYSEGERYKS